nr:MAG TPA: hypothetical protein [Caudoviricetes sp.]
MDCPLPLKIKTQQLLLCGSIFYNGGIFFKPTRRDFFS